MRILTLNSGSSSLKFALFELPVQAGHDQERRMLDGAIERIGTGRGLAWTRGLDQERRETVVPAADHEAAIASVFSALQSQGIAPEAVGHRLVHGGPRHASPTLLDSATVAALRDAVRFAPLHLPAELAGIDAVANVYPHMAQVACFDTGFHWSLPEIARRFALPPRCSELGARRYGFHGLSYEAILHALGARLEPRTIIVHLGNGSSMVAVQNGQSVDTTMGLTPCGGFMMGTRSGDLDPGVITFLLNEGWSAQAVEHLVNRESGLLGVSETSSDMQTLLEQRVSDPRAELAIAMFCYQARKSIGALSAVLGGIDLMVFTGGIGTHASHIRARICADLAYLGVELDPQRNELGVGAGTNGSASVVSSPRSRVSVLAMPTDEEAVIARHTRAVLASTAPAHA